MFPTKVFSLIFKKKTTIIDLSILELMKNIGIIIKVIYCWKIENIVGSLDSLNYPEIEDFKMYISRKSKNWIGKISK